VAARDGSDLLDLRARDFDRILEQAPVKSVLVNGGVKHVPKRECRDKGFAEDDEVGPGVPSFGDPLCKLGDRRFTIEENGRCVHRSSAEAGIGVTRHAGSPFLARIQKYFRYTNVPLAMWPPACSGGGEIGGLFDLVEQIQAIKSANTKPLWAVANENDCRPPMPARAITVAEVAR